MTDKKTKWSTNEKIRIVLQTFNPETKVAELCHEHNLSPRTLYMEGKVPRWWQECRGKIRHKPNPQNACQGSEHPQEDHRGVCRGQRGFKKNVGERQRVMAARETNKNIRLTKSLSYCSVSRIAWYYVRKPRIVAIDARMESEIIQIAKARPTYGTRRMAAQIARQSGIPVNRKKVARIYRKLGWTVPQMRKSEIIRSSRNTQAD